MPELPEVETIRRDLEKMILGKKIVSTEIRKKKIIRGKADVFVRILKRNSFIGIERIGKLLIFKLGKDGGYMLAHLKMTGQLVYAVGRRLVAGGHFTSDFNDLPNKHTHVIFGFSDESKLFFNDMRQFGFLEIVNKKRLDEIKEKYGIEPLRRNFTLSNLRKALSGRRIAIKALLLNQNIVSGIGNIYADEILFEAGVMPNRPTSSIKESELKKIFFAAQAILKKAIKYRGTTFSDYRDAGGKKGNFSRFLRVYGRDGEKCFRCKGVVKKMRVAGRGTRYCGKCQK